MDDDSQRAFVRAVCDGITAQPLRFELRGAGRPRVPADGSLSEAEFRAMWLDCGGDPALLQSLMDAVHGTPQASPLH